MMTNSDVTIFNLRIGADRREKLCATRILGVSWYGTKGETVLDTDRKDKAKCVKASDLEQIQWGAEIPEEFQNEVLKDYMKILASGGIS